MKERSIGFAPGFVIATATIFLALTGCASAPAPTEQVAPRPQSTGNVPDQPATPLPGEAAISTDNVCGQVTTLATLYLNTIDAFAAKAVSVDQYVAQLNMVATGYEHVLVNDSEVADRVGDVVQFLKTATPSAEGARFDRDSAGWKDTTSEVSSACQSAGSSIAANADFGG